MIIIKAVVPVPVKFVVFDVYLFYQGLCISDYKTLEGAFVVRNMGDMDALRRPNADMNVQEIANNSVEGTEEILYGNL